MLARALRWTSQRPHSPLQIASDIQSNACRFRCFQFHCWSIFFFISRSLTSLSGRCSYVILLSILTAVKAMPEPKTNTVALRESLSQHFFCALSFHRSFFLRSVWIIDRKKGKHTKHVCMGAFWCLKLALYIFNFDAMCSNASSNGSYALFLSLNTLAFRKLTRATERIQPHKRKSRTANSLIPLCCSN